MSSPALLPGTQAIAKRWPTLPKLQKFVEEYNIKIAVHNHGPKDTFPAPQDALKIPRGSTPAAVKASRGT